MNNSIVHLQCFGIRRAVNLALELYFVKEVTITKLDP